MGRDSMREKENVRVFSKLYRKNRFHNFNRFLDHAARKLHAHTRTDAQMHTHFGGISIDYPYISMLL